jgi:uncharacterized membrane protein
MLRLSADRIRFPGPVVRWRISMAIPAVRPERRPEPVLTVLAISCAPLFLGGLLADIAYARTYQIQWLNFAAWLIAGAMVFTGMALAWTLLMVVRSSFRDRASLAPLLLLAAMFLLGLLNSFVHARDAWGAMPGGLALSGVVTILAGALVWFVVVPRRRGAAI